MGSQDSGLAEFIYVASLTSRKDFSFMEEMINMRNGMKRHLVVWLCVNFCGSLLTSKLIKKSRH